MINSKEQYERIMRNAEFQGKMPVEHVGLLAETIEALQEVARDAKLALAEIDRHLSQQSHGSDSLSPELKSAYLILREALTPFDRRRLDKPPLPDWLTDG